MVIGRTCYRVGDLLRTMSVEVYVWGVRIVVRDRQNGRKNSIFETRSFTATKRYPTIEENIKRGMKYYRAPENEIGVMLIYHKLKSATA